LHRVQAALGSLDFAVVVADPHGQIAFAGRQSLIEHVRQVSLGCPKLAA
jgi:hypothetical protein